MIEMRQCPAARFLQSLSQIVLLRPLALKLAIRMEGGHYFSLTARWILAKHYGILIGDYSYGECFVPGAFPPGVKLGNYVSIGPDVRVYLRNHPLNRLSTHPFFYNRKLGFVSEDKIDSGALDIGHDVWVGAGTVILPSCSRIGLGAAVGARAVVTKSIPDFAVAVGNPARVIRMRFPEHTCRLILASRWWERSINECAVHLKEMTMNLDEIGEQHPLLLRHENSLKSS